MTFVVLCDFDGTIVDIDTCVYILEKFAGEDWRIYDEQFEKGEMTLEECLQNQFSTVVVPETRILDEIQLVKNVRIDFAELVEYCEASELRLVIVSAGLDFVIKQFLELEGWNGFIKVYAPKAKCTVDGIKLTFPRLFHNTSVNFKDDLVTHYKEQNKKVVYVGDGIADYDAARKADFPFAIKGSKLARVLKKNRIPHIEMNEFKKVVETIVCASKKR